MNIYQYSLYQKSKILKRIDFALLNHLNDLNSFNGKFRPRGGMVTQRIANPFIPVRFWAWPPINWLFYYFKESMLIFIPR